MKSSTPKAKLPNHLNPATPETHNFAVGRKCRQPALLVLTALILAKLGAYAVDPPAPAAPALGVPAPLPLASATAAATPSKAKIQFATPIYDFGKATAGEAISYTYIFTNVGTETLTIASVTPSCGCTTAGEWSRTAEPGKIGTIPIRFNSPNYGGPVAKTVTVKCNDPAQETIVLQIKGNIWQPIDVTPRYAMLNATTESPFATTTVRITNNLDQAITLSPPESNNKAFEAELKTIQEGRIFEVTVKTVPPLAAGNVSAIINLKTSATNMATVSITAFANVAPVVTVVPPTINLPIAPLAQPIPSVVTIRNTSTNALALSEPTINATGVDVQLKEIEPGRHFTATLNFPAGFEVVAGQTIELNLKSSNPQFASIKVPILQAARPVQTPVAARGQVIPAGPPPAVPK